MMGHRIEDVTGRISEPDAIVVIDFEGDIMTVDKTCKEDIILFGPTNDWEEAVEMANMYQYLAWAYSKSLYDLLKR